MKLKIKDLAIICFIITFSSQINAQEKGVRLNGVVKYDDKPLENINIINKTISLGSASNVNGAFQITASKGDSIEFSSIEYQNRIIKITENHINNKFISVYLEPGFNELDEVEILQKMKLDFGNVAVQNRTHLDIDEMDLTKAPDATDISGYNTQLTNGMDLVGIYNLLTKKSRAKKKTENDIKNEIEFVKRELPNTLRATYGDDFFTEWLHIENDEIHQFLDFCQGKGLGELYNSDEIYIKDFLVKQSVVFNNLKEEK